VNHPRITWEPGLGETQKFRTKSLKIVALLVGALSGQDQIGTTIWEEGRWDSDIYMDDREPVVGREFLGDFKKSRVQRAVQSYQRSVSC
jgi:hypothetical protein